MTINFELISGVMCGIEFFDDSETELSVVILDLLIFRIMIFYK